MLALISTVIGLLKDARIWKGPNKTLVIVLIVWCLVGAFFYEKLSAQLDSVTKKQKRLGSVIHVLPKMQRSLTRIEKALNIPQEENYYGPQTRGEVGDFDDE